MPEEKSSQPVKGSFQSRFAPVKVVVIIVKNKSSTSTVTVSYATNNGTALAGSDYTSAIGTLTFQPGQTSKTVSISVKGDRKREPNETLYVDLFEPVGATIADGSATATILNDD